MAKIVYERHPKADNADEVWITMDGTQTEMVSAVVEIINQLHARCGLDIDRFAAMLPALSALKTANMKRSEFFDLREIREQMKKRGGENV